jgi:predicted glycosyltransferase
MRIAFFINTPAQAHLYKNVIKGLERKGHETIALARRYGDTISLLDEIGLTYIEYSRPPTSKIGKMASLPLDIVRAYTALRKSIPDLILDAGIYGTYTSRLLGRPCVVFTDSEPTPLQLALIMPFAEAIVTPSSFTRDLGRKHLKVNSYKEFAYLHPNYFTPDEGILGRLGLDSDFILLRFNRFDAVHDFRIDGFSLGNKRELVRQLSRFARVVISSEIPLPKDLDEFRLDFPKSGIHDLIYYAKLVVTDTQTMTTEAAVLGTPVVRYNSFVGPNDMGNFRELESRYGLVFNYNRFEDAVSKAVYLLSNNGTKQEWANRREKLLDDKIDLCKFLTWLIEEFPGSLVRFKANPEIQDEFR